MNPLRSSALSAWILIGLLALQAAGVGYLIAGVPGIVVALGLGGLVASGVQAASPRTVLRWMGARAMGRREAPTLQRIAEVLAHRAGLAVAPRLALIPSPIPNAVAMGSADDPVVAVTQGLLRQLPPREVAGVLAHEISHLVHGDVRLLRMADGFSRLTRGAGQLGLLFGLFGAVVARLDLVGMGLLLALGPPTATWMILALSRQREYAADRAAARLTGDPLGLAIALRRIDASTSGWGWARGPAVAPGWRTHPATEDRVARLRDLA